MRLGRKRCAVPHRRVLPTSHPRRSIGPSPHCSRPVRNTPRTMCESDGRAGIKRFADGKPVAVRKLEGPRKKLDRNSPETRRSRDNVCRESPALPNPTSTQPNPSGPIPSCPTQPQAETPAAPELLRIHLATGRVGRGRRAIPGPASLTMAPGLGQHEQRHGQAVRHLRQQVRRLLTLWASTGDCVTPRPWPAPTGVLVKLMAQHAGIEMDQQSCQVSCRRR